VSMIPIRTEDGWSV